MVVVPDQPIESFLLTGGVSLPLSQLQQKNPKHTRVASPPTAETNLFMPTSDQRKFTLLEELNPVLVFGTYPVLSFL